MLFVNFYSYLFREKYWVGGHAISAIFVPIGMPATRVMYLCIAGLRAAVPEFPGPGDRKQAIL